MPVKAVVVRGVTGGFRDHNFRDGWLNGTVGGQTFSTDGDVVTITGISNFNVPPMIIKNVSINPAIYGRIVVRYRSSANGGNVQFALLFSDLTIQTFGPANGQSTTWQIDDEAIVAPVGTTITQIQLFIGNANPNTMAVQFDFVCISSNTYLDVTNDVLGGAPVNHVGKTATLQLKLQNEPPNAKYLTSPNIINISDMIDVWSADVFSVAGPAKAEHAFGGKIIGMPTSASKDGAAQKFLNIAAKGWGLGIERVTNSLIQIGVPDETIVANIIDQVNTAGQGWQLSKSIADVLSVNALDWLPEKRTAQQNLNNFSDWLSARRVAAVALNGSSDRGTDWWVSPAEVFTWQTIGVNGSVASYAQDPDLSSVQIEQFADPIINQVRLVGQIVLPITGDQTESDAANWANQIGIAAIADDAGVKVVGANSLKLTSDGTVNNLVAFRALPYGLDIDITKYGNATFPPSILGYYRIDSANITSVGFGLEDNGTPKLSVWSVDLQGAVPINTWIPFNLPTHKTGINTNSSYWYIVGVNNTAAVSHMWVDGLHILGTIVETAYDQSSINAHGLTEIVLRETTVYSPLELRRLARGHLYKWRLPTWTGSVTFTGWKSHQPGDIITLTLPDLNQTNKLYRVLSVTQKLPVGDQAAITSLEVTDQMVNLVPPMGTPNFIDIMKANHIPPIQTELAWNVYLAALVQGITETKTEVGTAI